MTDSPEEPRLHHVVCAVARQQHDAVAELFTDLGFVFENLELNELGLHVHLDWKRGIELVSPISESTAPVANSVRQFLDSKGNGIYTVVLRLPDAATCARDLLSPTLERNAKVSASDLIAITGASGHVGRNVSTHGCWMCCSWPLPPKAQTDWSNNIAPSSTQPPQGCATSSTRRSSAPHPMPPSPSPEIIGPPSKTCEQQR